VVVVVGERIDVLLTNRRNSPGSLTKALSQFLTTRFQFLEVSDLF
jgi:hypothetical protein